MFLKIESDQWRNDRVFVLDVLHNCYVLIVTGSGFCPVNGKAHFRFVFLPPVETLESAFDSIGSYMRKVA